MKHLFEPVRLNGKPLLWGHRSVTTNNFSGFYHLHQYCELLFVHEGKGSVIVNQKTFEIRRGMLFFFQPYQLHKVYADVSEENPYIRTLLHFDPYALEKNMRPFASRHTLFQQLWKGQSIRCPIDATAALGYLEQVFDWYDKTVEGGAGEEEDNQLLMIQIMNGISLALQGRGKNASDESPRSFSHAETIMQWIEEHYNEDIQLEDIAEALHLSKFYISRLFLAETGSGIAQYLTGVRIRQACRLLRTTNLPVERIGFEVGIPNPSYFIRIFKKWVGATPLKYRNSDA